MIGVFWIYKSKIYVKSVDTASVKEIKGFVDSDFAHYQVWNEIVPCNKDFYMFEYEDIPRGRIVYDVASIQYIVYANMDIIGSDEAKRLIIDAFKLEKFKVIFQFDEHYKIDGV